MGRYLIPCLSILCIGFLALEVSLHGPRHQSPSVFGFGFCSPSWRLWEEVQSGEEGADRVFAPLVLSLQEPFRVAYPSANGHHYPEVVSIQLSILQILPTSLFPCFLSLTISSVLFWLPMVPAFCSVVTLISAHDIVNRYFLLKLFIIQFSSVQFSRSVVSDSLRPHESQHARPPCPSPTPGVHSELRPSSQ